MADSLSLPHLPPPSPELEAYLRQFVTEARQAKMDAVLAERTRWLRIVLEDIYQPHNASACLRSCEALGVQRVDIIENRNAFQPSGEVAMGAQHWLSLHRHREPNADNTRGCLGGLKAQGYQIVATALSDDTVDLDTLPLDQPVALCFGTEEVGLSATALELADRHLKIPMVGFTQSFNISVSVAICVHALTRRIRQEVPDHHLSRAEQAALRLHWLYRSVPNGPAHLRHWQALQTQQ